jgi:cardiolipin-specific phospholipase
VRIDELVIDLLTGTYPVLYLDGDHDWMDPQGGYQAVENMRKAGNGQGRMYVVPNAGHHG